MSGPRKLLARPLHLQKTPHYKKPYYSYPHYKDALTRTLSSPGSPTLTESQLNEYYLMLYHIDFMSQFTPLDAILPKEYHNVKLIQNIKQIKQLTQSILNSIMLKSVVSPGTNGTRGEDLCRNSG